MNSAEIKRLGLPRDTRCGEIESITIMHSPPERFSEFGWYAVAVIKIVGREKIGVKDKRETEREKRIGANRVTARLTDIDIKNDSVKDSYGNTIDIGTRVESVTRVGERDGETGLIRYIEMWRPLVIVE